MNEQTIKLLCNTFGHEFKFRKYAGSAPNWFGGRAFMLFVKSCDRCGKEVKEVR